MNAAALDRSRTFLLPAALAGLALIWLLPPLYLVLGVAAVATVALTLRVPAAGFALLCLSVPWGSSYSLTVASFPVSPTDLLVAAVTAAWLARAVVERRHPIVATPWNPYIVLLIAAMSLSVAAAADSRASAREIVKWLELAAVYGSAVYLLRSRREVTLVVAALVAGGISQAVLGYVQAAAGAGPAAFISRGGLLRAYGTFDQPNPYAGYLNLVLPFTVSLAVLVRRVRVAAGSAAAVILGSLVLSQSRGALLGTMLALTVMAGLEWTWARRVIGYAVPAAVAGALLANVGLLPLGPFERLLDAVGLGSVSFDHVTNANFSAVERAAHWLAGVRMFAAHPLLGVGIGNYEVAYPAYHPRGWYAPLGHAHDYYINIAAETGIAGLTAYLLWAGSALWYSYAVLCRLRAGFCRAVVLGVVGALVATNFHNLFDVLYVHGVVSQIGLLAALVPLSLRLDRTPLGESIGSD